jgi:fructose-specific component phosphotransferase system IIB-like protein
LYTAADLLTGPGCPVCRYAGEVGDRYLAWFALEAHADTVTITRLCSSLGMCARHTRALMSQPGAASRLTAVYRYIVEAARDRLSGRAASIAACPACEHDDGAVGRALDTLLEGLADDPVRERYRELGGLCIPHLGTASVRGGHRVAAWLSQTMMAAAARSASLGWLAETDHDADVRAVLRQAAPPSARPGSGACLACLAAARSENTLLTQILRTTGRGQRDDLLLCAGHLGDLVVLAGQPGAASVLAWQAACLAAGLTRPAPSPGRKLGAPVGWLRSGRRRAAGPDGCPVCLATQGAAHRAIDDLRASLRASRVASHRWAPLCVRHLLGLRAADPWAGHATARGAVARADILVAELNEAFSKNTWARRHEARGPEMTAWRRAAAFLDGSVFCGCPPHDA